MSILVALVFTRSTIAKSIKANICLVLRVEEPFNRTDVRFLLLSKELDTFSEDLFPFRVRKGLEGLELFTQHAIRCRNNQSTNRHGHTDLFKQFN
jgi:hypothetical protein